MCMSCGCMEPNNDHGDARNLTQQDLDRAAEAAGVDRQQAAENIMVCCQTVAHAEEQNQEQER